MTGPELSPPDRRAGRLGATFSQYVKFARLLRPFLRGNGRALAIAYATALGGIAAGFGAPWFLSLMLDRALLTRDLRMFWRYTAGILICLAVFLACSLLKSYLFAGAAERMFLALRRRFVATLLRKPPAFFARHDSGDLITRLSNDTEQLSLLFFDYVLASINGLTLMVVFFAAMLAINRRLGLYCLAALPVYVLLLTLVQRPLTRAAAAARERLSRQSDTMLDLLGGTREIRFYQQFAAADRRFAAAAGQFTKANIRSVFIGEWSYNAMELFAAVATLLPFLVGGYWICRGNSFISLGVLVAFNLYLGQIGSALATINVGAVKLAQEAPLVDRIQEVLGDAEEDYGAVRGATEMADAARIEFRDVSFSYDGVKPVIENFSLVIEPGDKVALMGPSGSGKSTIVDLLIRQLKPDRGRILFGGKDIALYYLPHYLLFFAFVRQRPYMFKTSVRENISAGWYNPPLDVIIDAAKRVHIHDDIMRLPRRYDTVIGARGADLSLGQQQRIALARAVVRGPAIWLLDEFTSALDRQTEESILTDLLAGASQQTILCVTHSPNVAKHFSKVIELEKR